MTSDELYCTLGSFEHMDPLNTFVTRFFIDLGVSVFFAGLLLLILKRRELWLRYTAAEASFWLHLGLPRRFVESTRRLQESRWLAVLVSIVLAESLLATALHGIAYLYFKDRISHTTAARSVWPAGFTPQRP